MTRLCRVCEKAFDAKGRAVTCGDCRGMRGIAKCKNCGVEFKYGGDRRGLFCSLKCQAVHRSKQTFEAGTASANSRRANLIREHGYVCSICETTEWMGKPVPVIVDHISGNPYDHRPENLRLVCPNCDAQLPTFKAKNKGKGRKARADRARADYRPDRLAS